MSQKNVGKRCPNYSNWAQSQKLFYRNEQHMVLDKGTKYEQNHHILWDITALKIYEKVAKITLSKPDRGIQYEENAYMHPAIMEEGLRMDWQMDWQTDWWTGPFPIFRDST